MGKWFHSGRPLAYAAAFVACSFLITGQNVEAAEAKAKAADAKIKAVAHSLAKTPMMKGVKIADIKASGKHFTGKFGTKKVPADIFNTGTDKKPVWHVAFSPKTFSLKKVFKAKATAALGELSLANVGLIMSSGAAKKIKLTSVPKTVQARVKKVFGSKLKEIALKEGANFFATLDIAKSGVLGLVKKHLGVKDKVAGLSGTISRTAVNYLLTGQPGKKPSTVGVDLYFALSGLKPTKVSKIFSTGTLVMNLKGVKTKQGHENLKFAGSSKATIVINKKKLVVPVALNLERNPSPDPKKEDRYFDITGGLGGKALNAIKIRDYVASNLTLNGGLTAQKKIALAIEGEAVNKAKKKLNFTGKVDIASRVPEFEMVLSGDLTVKDVIGATIPGLDGLKFKEAQFGNAYTSGKVNLNGDEMSAVAFKLGKLPAIAFMAKTFDMTQHIPGFENTIFGQTKMTNAALIVVPQKGVAANVPTKDLPDPVRAVTDAAIGKGETLELKQGVNFAFKMDTRKDAALKTLAKMLGAKLGHLEFKGRVSLAMLKQAAKNQDQKPATVRQQQQRAAANKKQLSEFLSDMSFEAEFPAINLPVVREFIQFKNPVFTVAGAPVEDDRGRPTANNEVKISINGGMDLKFPGKTISMASVLGLTKGLEDKKALAIEVESSSKIDWSKAFGIPFLTLNDIGLGGTIARDAQGKDAVGLKIFSTVKLGAQTVKSSGEIVIGKAQKKKPKAGTKKIGFALPAGIDDIVFKIEDKVDLAKLPGIGSIPGIKEFAFKDIQLSPAYMAGDLTWTKKKITAQAAFLNNAGTFGLFFRMKNLKFNSLIPIPKPMGDIKFPAMVMALSTKKMNDVTFGELPERVQDLFDGIVVKNDAGEIVDEDQVVPVYDGVTLLTALDFKALPAKDPVRQVIEVELGIKEPLVIAGGVSGVFSGTPKMALYAQLPGLVLPKNQPLSRVVSFNKVGASFFLRADVAATVFQAGARGAMTISIPHLDNPKKVDKVTFNGELYASVDAVSAAGGVKAGGGMAGKWREPFGLKNFAFNDPAFVIGADSEGSVEFGVGGSAEFKVRGGQTLDYAADFITNINFSSTFPIPKKLGIVLKGKKFGAIAQMEIADALFRGVVTGPMAKEMTKLLPDPVSRKAVQTLQAQLKKTSLLDIMQVDKIPLPLIEMQDVELFFATPGAIIPGREDTLDTIGMRVKGQANLVFMGKKDKLGKVDNRLTIKDGLKVFAEVPARNLGPIKLSKGAIDVQANIYSLPHFKIKGGTNIFGAKENLEVELSAKQALFAYDKDLGPLVKMNIVAKTVGEDLFRAKDFIVKASTKTSIDKVLTKEVMPRLGIPKAVGNLISSLNPMFIDGGAFEGSLTEFVTGKPVTLKLEHKIFGRRVPPAVVELKPVWKDPLSAFPAIPIAKALRNSFLIDLAKNPVSMPSVNLGLIKIEKAKLTALVTDIKDPKFVVSGKTDFLGNTRAVDLALSDKGYAFRVKDKIGAIRGSKAALWDADFRVWSVGGTAQAPNDVKYWGRLDSDFEKWLQKELGGSLNKGFNAVNAGYTTARKKLRDAENKVKNLDGVIQRNRERARRDLNNLRTFIDRAKRHVDRTHWLMRRAQRTFDAYDRRYHDSRRGAWAPWHWAAVAVNWGLRAGAWTAAKAAEGVYHAAQAAHRAIDKGLANIPLDLHPTVAPIIVARNVAVGTLQTARLALRGAQHLNSEFKSVTNSLINAVAGAKILVVKKATFQGSVKETRSNFFILGDIMGHENVTLKMKINILKPWETDLRALTATLTALIKGEKAHLERGNIPGPPELPVATVSKADLRKAIVAAMRAEAKLRAEAKAKEEARKRQLAAATQPNPARPAGNISNSVLIGHEGRCLNFSTSERNRRGARRAVLQDCHGKANQRFTMRANGELRADGLCLDNQEGGWLWGYKCTGHPSMRYRLLADGRLQNIRSGECVDLPGGRGGNGKPLRFGTCSTAAHQKWKVSATLPRRGTPHVRFRNMYIAANDNKACLDSWPQGGNLGAIACQAHPNLRFTFWSDGTIRHDPQDKCINIQTRGLHGQPAIVATCNGHADQKWRVDWSGGRGPSNIDRTWRFRMVSTRSGRCLTARGGKTYTDNCVGSTNADTWPASQTWRADKSPLVPIVATPDKIRRNLYIAANNNNACLDSWPQGGNLGAIACQAHPNLRFTFWSDGTLRHDPQDKCVNVQTRGLHGQPVVVATCDGHVDQKWRVQWSGRGPSGVDPTWRFRLISVRSGRCLTVRSGRTYTDNCVGSSNASTWPISQTWRAGKEPLKPLREQLTFNLAQLVNARSGQCVDEDSGNLTKGAPLIMWGCNSSGDRRKRQLFSHNARGQITTTNGLCVDVKNPNVVRGIPIILWNCNSGGSSLQRQRWRVLADTRIQHIQSGLCLDSTDNANQRGRLVLSTCSTTPTQKWRPNSARSG